jgi:hypothetical protein
MFNQSKSNEHIGAAHPTATHLDQQFEKFYYRRNDDMKSDYELNKIMKKIKDAGQDMDWLSVYHH